MSTNSSLKEIRLQQLRNLQRAAEELKARKALESAYYWLTECTKTEDEQDPVAPYKPFPKDREYIPHLLDAIENEPVLYIKKSRTMMGTWTVCGWAAHHMFTHPMTTIVFQSEDMDRAINCVKMVKALWRHSLPSLQARWRLRNDKLPDEQSIDIFEMANGSWCRGIPGKNPDKIRSLHPTIYIQDESAIIAQGQESSEAAAATRCLKMIHLSSAFPGWFEDKISGFEPIDWPDYKSKRKAA